MKMWISRTKEHGLYLAPVMPRYHEGTDYWLFEKSLALDATGLNIY